MAIFIPILLFAGAAGLSFLSSGCGGKNTSSSHPNPPPSSTNLPEYPKSALDLKSPDGTESSNGYDLLLRRFEENSLRQKGQPFSIDSILQKEGSGLKIPILFKDPTQAELAVKFARHVGTHDERPNDISLYDVFYETYHLHGQQWKEGWQSSLLGKDFKSSTQDRVLILGAPLLDASGSQTLSTQSKALIQSLSIYLQNFVPVQPPFSLLPQINFFMTMEDPEDFSKYLKTPYADFLRLDESKQIEVFQKAVQAKFPDMDTAERLLRYLTPDQGVLFIRECLRKDATASLDLFEKVRFPNWVTNTEKTSGESEFFPNLPQDTPFAKRQKAIDKFLGEPTLTLKRKNAGQGGKTVATTIKKYTWVGSTEVFSIESGKPGPTTLVFAPHYHEENPRKMFHWIKDVPLKTGRILLIPEANRALGLSGADTNPMNSLFNKAFRDDRMDYLVVRRTEYLMGLVDGMIGLHDWKDRKPFYISDVIVDFDGKKGADQSPIASPWVPQEAKDIKKIERDIEMEKDPHASEEAGEPAPMVMPPQIQWQIAEYSAKRLEKLTGETFAFTATPLPNSEGYRIGNATAYMDLFLKKPAMTFECNAQAEQGQLMARLVYTLLLGYGHGIDVEFEKKLQEASPTREPELYQGVAIRNP